MSTSVLVIDNDDSYTYNLVQQVAALTGELPDVIAAREFDPRTEGDYAAIIVSPGPGHPLTEPGFRSCLQLFAERVGPLMGVCLGHQGLIIANGGLVVAGPPAHGVVDRVHHTGTGLFAGLPQDMDVVRYHSLSATEIPEVLEVTARSATGVVMAVAHKARPHVGVQFHPESILTPDGSRLVENFLRGAGVPLVSTRHAPAQLGARKDPLRPVTTSPTRSVLASRWVDPARVASVLLRGRERAFWLDSADRREWTGRYSVMGYLTEDEESVCVGDESTFRSARPLSRASFLRHLEELCRELPGNGDAGIHPAIGGWVGVAGYDAQELLEDDSIGTAADGFFLRVNRAVVFDHEERTVTCYARTAGEREELRATVDELTTGAETPPPASAPPAPELPELSPQLARQYSAAYQRLQRALREGETYEAVLTFSLPVVLEGDPLDQYLALRHRNPAPYAAYLRHGTHSILSSSPELMLSVDDDRRATVRPIKGTIGRGIDEQSDALRRWALATDEKCRRENLMITDLIRNDLGQISEIGTVAVTRLMSVETYPRVHQLVTTVAGRLRADVSPLGALRAVFPAGSMTGAPKKRTMQLIRDAEWSSRGAYSGAVGWFTDRRAEFSVLIRALAGTDDEFRLQVGGGIIVGSTEAGELAEAWEKARSVVSD